MITRSAALMAVAAVVLAGPALAQVKKVDELKYGKLPAFEIPSPERVVLDNGMVLLLMEDHELPLVRVTGRIRTGARHEPADKVGLAGLTGQVWRAGGTTTRAPDELNELLEGMAASVETGIGTESGFASASCLKEDFPAVLAIFADVLRNPAFAEEQLEVAKTQLESGISRQNDNPGGIIAREFAEVVYGPDSPYARSATYETAAAITRDDLVAWHRTFVHPDRVILGIWGDFETDAMVSMIRKVLGDWERGPELELPDAPYRKTAPAGLYYIRKDDMTQSEIRMGHLGIVRENPDYYAVRVMNEVLGGSFGARLFSNIRSREGLAYRVRGSVGDSWDHPGMTMLNMSTKVGTTGEALEALLGEARDMVRKPPTDAEVARAKQSILNSFVFEYDSTSEVLADQVNYEYYGYPTDWLSRYRKGIEAVTTARVREAAKKYLRPDDFAIMVLGPSEGLDRPLADFGEVTRVDITIPEPSAERVEVTAVALEKGAALIARAVEGVGGATALDALSSLDMSVSIVAMTPGGEMQLETRLLMAHPGRYRQEMSMPFGKMAMVVTPEASFMESPQGTRPLGASQRTQVEAGLQRALPAVLLRLRHEPGFQAVAAGTGNVEGRPVQLVAVELAGETTTLGVDPETGRVLQVTYRGAPMGGPPGEMVSRFDDFREVDGLVLPFRSSTTYNGEPAFDGSTSQVQVNAPVDDTAFAAPTAS